MIRRVIAAVAALVLAAVGVVLVVSYANRAEDRALQGTEPVDVLVAMEALTRGTPGEQLHEMVEVRAIPQAAVASGAITDVAELDGMVLAADVAAGEQLHELRLITPEELRASGQVPLPEGVEDLHQVTIALEKPRALGGNVTVGDTVGVFMSFEIEGQEGVFLTSDGQVVVQPAPEDDGADGDEDETASADGINVSTTHLTLHKVAVTRVEGGAVTTQDVDGEEERLEAADTLQITLALPAPDAERLVYAMEFGNVWLSLEPESADEEGTGPVVVTIPGEARDVLQ